MPPQQAKARKRLKLRMRGTRVAQGNECRRSDLKFRPGVTQMLSRELRCEFQIDGSRDGGGAAGWVRGTQQVTMVPTVGAGSMVSSPPIMVARWAIMRVPMP